MQPATYQQVVMMFLKRLHLARIYGIQMERPGRGGFWVTADFPVRCLAGFPTQYQSAFICGGNIPFPPSPPACPRSYKEGGFPDFRLLSPICVHLRPSAFICGLSPLFGCGSPLCASAPLPDHYFPPFYHLCPALRDGCLIPRFRIGLPTFGPWSTFH